MSSSKIHAPGFESPLEFDVEQDLLGSGTVGEVFKVRLNRTKDPTHFALKRFFTRAGRDDFQNETSILKALEDTRPTYYFLWHMETFTISSCTQPPPRSPADLVTWLVAQMQGICDAIRYIHHHVLGKGNGQTKRVGFHHDLKPANILLFVSNQPNSAIWKLSDFGSGAVKYLDLSSTEILYNRKASTGDPVYSAPEFVADGKVSQPKDIWSLGCIFLEVLVWALTLEPEAVTRFREARTKFSTDSPDKEPIYWCQDSEGRVYMNPAVMSEFEVLQAQSTEIVYKSILAMVGRMLELSPNDRPEASALFLTPMEMTFTLKFLKRLSLYDQVQPYRLHGFPELSDEQQTNCVYENIECTNVQDIRNIQDGSSIPHLSQAGFEFFSAPSKCSLSATVFESDAADANAIVNDYIQETMELVKSRLCATSVVTIDWRFRRDDNMSFPYRLEGGDVRKQAISIATTTHCDFSSLGGLERLRMHLNLDELAAVEMGDVTATIVNVWRPLKTVTSAPLVLADRRTVLKDDLIEADQVMRDKVNKTAYVYYHPDQRWYWLSNQRPDEIIMFPTWAAESDDGHADCSPHAAAYLYQPNKALPPRESVEIRMVVLSRSMD
ncbi:hypothetical protein O1611_g1535 [Lasiodiplodia mahajangana]|uniref:Uncharacterized protein n=1 Tax=Lasiodiplodia mahajangana TaxID=1108764 RepID=A0ACC2JXR4_9PEZI|nr:hypothetical protein O1611_g1535 [Lasiodiplodia mahajangana]